MPRSAPIPAELQLVISGYAASYAVFLITGGRLGDLYGRRRLFLIGMAGFVATNTLCGLAATPLQLVIGRVLQGVSAAMLVPQVLGSIRALFPSEAELAKALSFYGVMMGLAASIGQFSGGALVEWSPFDWGWRTVFLAKLPIGIPVMLAAWLMVPETSASRRQRLDIGGAVLVSLALACLVLPLSEGRQQGWPAWTFVMLAAVPFLAAAFLWFEAPGDRARRQPAARPRPDGDPQLPARRAGRHAVLLHHRLLHAVRDLRAGGLRHRPAVHRPRHPALRHRPVRRPAGHRAAGPAAARGC